MSVLVVVEKAGLMTELKWAFVVETALWMGAIASLFIAAFFGVPWLIFVMLFCVLGGILANDWRMTIVKIAELEEDLTEAKGSPVTLTKTTTWKLEDKTISRERLYKVREEEEEEEDQTDTAFD